MTAVKLDEIKYTVSLIAPSHRIRLTRQDFPTISFDAHESIEMPFRECLSSRQTQQPKCH